MRTKHSKKYYYNFIVDRKKGSISMDEKKIPRRIYIMT